MIVAEDKAIIHAALEDSGGDRRAAAVKLGISQKQLNVIIHSHPDLKAAWATESLAVEVADDTATVKALTVAAKNETALLKKGWKALGIKDRLMDFALSTQSLSDAFFDKTIDVARAGAVKQYVSVGGDIDDVRKQIEDGLASGDLPLPREMILREHLINLLKVQSELSAQIKGYTLIAAKVKLMQKQADGKQRSGKPGFAPLVAVKVEGNATIHEANQE